MTEGVVRRREFGMGSEGKDKVGWKRKGRERERKERTEGRWRGRIKKGRKRERIRRRQERGKVSSEGIGRAARQRSGREKENE